MIKAFIDTNVLMDVFEQREPFYEHSSQIWTLAESRQIQAFISAISFNNIFYLCRRHANLHTAQKAIELLDATFEMVPLDRQIMGNAIKTKKNDFEDSIQLLSAMAVDADCIITRNIQDFRNAPIKTATPQQFLSLIDSFSI
ncbi:MAG: PIN domain-containing protein [Victivallales bacterium]|nr:PIN domain-containing protein [Victivallales bacterium]